MLCGTRSWLKSELDSAPVLPGHSGTASHVDVITWAADDTATLRLAEVTTGLPTFLQFLEV